MTQHLLGQPLVLGQSWTLAYELVFYGLVSVLFVAGLHRRSVALSVVLLRRGARRRQCTEAAGRDDP